MPIEDASVVWPEEESPYHTVAQLRLPRQEAFSPAGRAYVDGLSFCVSHSLTAHRPLGPIMRARLGAYPFMSRLRRQKNGQSCASLSRSTGRLSKPRVTGGRRRGWIR